MRTPVCPTCGQNADLCGCPPTAIQVAITRSPRDGRPYYCALCGLGYAEFLACEEPNCRLETEAEAKKRC